MPWSPFRLFQFSHLNRNRLNRRSRQGRAKSNRLFSITLRCLKNQKSPLRIVFILSSSVSYEHCSLSASPNEPKLPTLVTHATTRCIRFIARKETFLPASKSFLGISILELKKISVKTLFFLTKFNLSEYWWNENAILNINIAPSTTEFSMPMPYSFLASIHYIILIFITKFFIFNS